MTEARRVQSWRYVAAAACVAFALIVRAGESADTMTLLQTADSIKLSDPGRFDALMEEIGGRLRGASDDERQYFLLLQGWKSAYEGKDGLAVTRLSRLASGSPSATIRFRAYA